MTNCAHLERATQIPHNPWCRIGFTKGIRWHSYEFWWWQVTAIIVLKRWNFPWSMSPPAVSVVVVVVDDDDNILPTGAQHCDKGLGLPLRDVSCVQYLMSPAFPEELVAGTPLCPHPPHPKGSLDIRFHNDWWTWSVPFLLLCSLLANWIIMG